MHWPHHHDNDNVERRLDDHDRRLARLERSSMATQEQIDALTASVQQIATDLDTARTTIQTEIDNLSAADPNLNIDALTTALEPIDAAVQALGALQPTPPATT